MKFVTILLKLYFNNITAPKGLPFYGRSYLDAKELYVPHGGLDEINWKEDDGSPQYFNIMARMGEMTSVRDNVTKTQYAYFDNGMGMVTYDDERAICDKAEYVLDFGLGGFIICEFAYSAPFFMSRLNVANIV